MNNWIEQRRSGEFAEASQGVEAAPAATVVLLRDGDDGLEVLLARRSSKLAFHGGAWVFPGGRIDPDDYGDAPDDLLARRTPRRRYARRMEEAGVDVDGDALVHLSNWTTPEELAQAFRDVVLRRARSQAATRSPTAPRWTRCSGSDRPTRSRRATRARSSWRRRSTSRCSSYARSATVADAMAAIEAGVAIDYLPRFHFIEGGAAICVYPEDVAYDDLAKLDAPGPRHRLLLGGESWEYVRD